MIFTHTVESDKISTFDINQIDKYEKCVFLVFSTQEQCVWAEKRIGAMLGAFTNNIFFMLYKELIDTQLSNNGALYHLYLEAYQSHEILKELDSYALVFRKVDLVNGQYEAVFRELPLFDNDERERLVKLKCIVLEIIKNNFKDHYHAIKNYLTREKSGEIIFELIKFIFPKILK